MKNDVFRFSSRKQLLLPMMLTALLAGTPQWMAAATNEDGVASVQQAGVVKGQVVDADGEPVIGASVLVKGTTNGVITDLNGNFTVQNATGKTLVISYVGYKTQEIQVGNQQNLSIVLKEDSGLLEEVVVVGYGTQKKATLTGSVTMVNGEDVLQGRPTTNIATSLQGTIPGLTITRTTARPTENPSVTLRGGISTNSNAPLYLIDGVAAYSWELNTINPSDIESVSVLKDASASIYGAQAAGGVILITTKRGKAGKLSITYNGSVSFDFMGRDYPAATGSQWAKMMLNAVHNDPNTSPWAIMEFTEDEYRRVANNETFDQVTSDGTMYRIDPLHAYQPDYVFGTTVSNQHNITISGGSEKLQNKLSVGYSNDRSIIKATYDGQKKYNLRNNTDFQINRYVKLSTDLSYDYRIQDIPSYGVGYGLQDFYVFPLYTQDGKKYYDNFGGNNVLAHLKEGGRHTQTIPIFRITGKIVVDLDFIHKSLKGLSFSAKGNIRLDTTTSTKTQKTIQMYDYYTGEVTNNAQSSSQSTVPTITEGHARNQYQDYEFFLNYDRTFKKHHVAAMLGNTNEINEKHDMVVKETATDNVALDELSMYDTTTITLNSHDAYRWAFVSYLGRVNYDYDGKYLFEGSWRRDGSSKLTKAQRWSDFFSASAGWRISEENFVKDNAEWLDNLKLRLSWGQSGNLSSIGNYESYATMGSGTTVLGTSPSLVPTAWVGGLTDTSRTWERVVTTNVGLDWGLFGNRLNGNFDYFWRKNKGMLISITYPQVLGASAPATNAGNYKVHGWELALNWQDHINKDWSYNVGFTLADARTKITSYEGATAISAGANGTVEGYPINSLWVYKTDGLFQSQSDVDNYYATMNGNVSGSLISNVTQGTDNALTPGCVRRVDLNGDNDITTADLYYYGDTAPHYTFGINLGVSYKNFDLSAFFQGVGQQYNVRTGVMACGFAYGWTNTNGYYLNNTWTDDTAPYNPGHQGNNVFPILSRNGNRNTWNYTAYNDVNVMHNWYVRCKTLQLGYTLPKSFLSKVNIQNLRVWVAGENLFDISNVKDGLDPEGNSNSGTYSGVEIYPKSVSLGLDITF